MTPRRWLGAIAVAVLGVCLLGTLNLVQSRSLANEARSSILNAVSRAEAGELEEAREGLAKAVDQLETARTRVDSPWASVVGAIPFLHTEIRAGAAGISAVREVTHAILEILDFAVQDRPPLFEEGRIDPGAILQLDGSLGRALERTKAAQRVIASAPRPRLGSVRDPLEEVEDTTATVFDVLSGGRPLLQRIGVAAAGGDPFQILLLLENGAELRATGGLPGFVALLEIDEQGISVRRVESVTAVRDPTGEFVTVDAPADYLRRYGVWEANTTLWSNVNMSPDFPTVADIARRLYAGVTGVESDMVVRIDLVALGYLLEAFPDLVVDGEPLEARTLATEFLIDSYNRFTEREQNEYLPRVVRQVFDQMLGGAAADQGVLLRGARRAVSERRIGFFVDEDPTNQLFAATGSDGRVLPGESGDLEVIVQNFAESKIDLFTETAISVETESAGCFVDGSVTITLANRLPGGTDFPTSDVWQDLGRWWVSFYLPANAVVVDRDVDGEPSAGTTDVEFDRPVASVLVTAEPGAETTATVRWQEQIFVPDYRLRLQPQPLVVPAMLSIGGGEPRVFGETTVATVETDCGR